MTASPIETTIRQDEVATIVAVVAGTNGDVVFSEIEDVENDEPADRLEAQLDAETNEDEIEVEKTEADGDEAEPVAKTPRAVHEHKPSIAYVEMIVRKREDRGGITKTALAQYRLDMLTKHGLPTTKKEQDAAAQAQAAAKAEAKAADKLARSEARAAEKMARLLETTEA